MYRTCVLLLTVLSTAVLSEKIPKELHFESCKYEGPNFEACLKHAIQDAIPKLKNGASSIGIPKLDPLEITEIFVDQSNTGPMNMKLKFKNIKLYGIAKSNLNTLRYVKEKRLIIINGTNEKIVMQGSYESKGKLLSFPMEGNGPFTIELTDVSTDMAMHFKDVERKGVRYLDLADLEYYIPHVGHSKSKMENMIRGNKALDESLNQSLNDNWKELDRQIRPAFAKALRLYFLDITQRFFRKVPFNEVFPTKK